MNTNSRLSELLDALEIAVIRRASARRAFQAGERWVDDGKASHPTERYLLDADEEVRAARSGIEGLNLHGEHPVRALTEEECRKILGSVAVRREVVRRITDALDGDSRINTPDGLSRPNEQRREE